MPLLVVGLPAMAGLRSLVALPPALISGAGTVATLMFAAALFGPGAALHLPTLRRTGGRAAVLDLMGSLVPPARRLRILLIW